jgi:hypothetical protein
MPPKESNEVYTIQNTPNLSLPLIKGVIDKRLPMVFNIAIKKSEIWKNGILALKAEGNYQNRKLKLEFFAKMEGGSITLRLKNNLKLNALGSIPEPRDSPMLIDDSQIFMKFWDVSLQDLGLAGREDIGRPRNWADMPAQPVTTPSQAPAAPTYQGAPAPAYQNAPAPAYQTAPAPAHQNAPAPAYQNAPAPASNQMPAGSTDFNFGDGPNQPTPAPTYQNAPAPAYQAHKAPRKKLSLKEKLQKIKEEGIPKKLFERKFQKAANTGDFIKIRKQLTEAEELVKNNTGLFTEEQKDMLRKKMETNEGQITELQTRADGIFNKAEESYKEKKYADAIKGLTSITEELKMKGLKDVAKKFNDFIGKNKFNFEIDQEIDRVLGAIKVGDLAGAKNDFIRLENKANKRPDQLQEIVKERMIEEIKKNHESISKRVNAIQGYMQNLPKSLMESNMNEIATKLQSDRAIAESQNMPEIVLQIDQKLQNLTANGQIAMELKQLYSSRDSGQLKHVVTQASALQRRATELGGVIYPEIIAKIGELQAQSGGAIRDIRNELSNFVFTIPQILKDNSKEDAIKILRTKLNQANGLQLTDVIGKINEQLKFLECIGKIENLFAMSDRLRIDDVTKMIDMKREELLDMMLEHHETFGHLKIDGDDLVKNSSFSF